MRTAVRARVRRRDLFCVRDFGGNRGAEIFGCGPAADVRRANLGARQNFCDGVFYRVGGSWFLRGGAASSRRTRSARSDWQFPFRQCPARSRAPARTSTGYSFSGFRLADGAMPIEPTTAGPRSESMSPNRFEPTTTSNQSGWRTKCAVRMSMWYWSVRMSGYSAAIAESIRPRTAW